MYLLTVVYLNFDRFFIVSLCFETVLMFRNVVDRNILCTFVV